MRPRVLMLLDRDPRFAIGSNLAFGLSYSPTPDPTDDYYFTVSHLLSKLPAVVTKAHRQTDPASDKGAPTPADIENFKFTTASLSAIDEVWLIGYNSVRSDKTGLTAAERSSVLSDSELAVLTTFMNSGGGVFAVGDHGAFGVSLSGSVPRVRTMRNWWYPASGPFGDPPAPPMLGNDRLDTTRYGNEGPAAAHTVWFDDQSDDIPQYLDPIGSDNLCYEPIVYDLNPHLIHPLLQGPRGAILGFPDHMHEGEVVLPYEYDRVFTFAGKRFPEYPAGPTGVVKPQIVAWSTTNGAASVVPTVEAKVHTGDDSPSHYRRFGAIGAYDGRLASVGRVVTQSTFHHFIDINLIGDPMAPPGPKRSGFQTEGGAAILKDIEAYYANLVDWLAPPGVAKYMWPFDIADAMKNPTVREVAHNPPDGAMDLIGQMAIGVLAQTSRPGMLLDRLFAVLPEGIALQFPAFPWGPVSGTVGCGRIDHMAVLRRSLGAAVLAGTHVATGRGTSVFLEPGEAQEVVLAATIDAFLSAGDELADEGARLVRVADVMRAERSRRTSGRAKKTIEKTIARVTRRKEPSTRSRKPSS
jgi:hypothetical protein